MCCNFDKVTPKKRTLINYYLCKLSNHQYDFLPSSSLHKYVCISWILNWMEQLGEGGQKILESSSRAQQPSHFDVGDCHILRTKQSLFVVGLVRTCTHRHQSNQVNESASVITFPPPLPICFPHVELAGRSRNGCQTCNYPTKQAEIEIFNVFKLTEKKDSR